MAWFDYIFVIFLQASIKKWSMWELNYEQMRPNYIQVPPGMLLIQVKKGKWKQPQTPLFPEIQWCFTYHASSRHFVLNSKCSYKICTQKKHPPLKIMCIYGEKEKPPIHKKVGLCEWHCSGLHFGSLFITQLRHVALWIQSCFWCPEALYCTCILLIPRNSLWSSIKGCKLFSSRILFSARWSSTKETWPIKEVSFIVLIRFWSSTSSRRYCSPSSPSIWLISLPGTNSMYSPLYTMHTIYSQSYTVWRYTVGFKKQSQPAT